MTAVSFASGRHAATITWSAVVKQSAVTLPENGLAVRITAAVRPSRIDTTPSPPQTAIRVAEAFDAKWMSPGQRGDPADLVDPVLRAHCHTEPSDRPTKETSDAAAGAMAVIR